MTLELLLIFSDNGMSETVEDFFFRALALHSLDRS